MNGEDALAAKDYNDRWYAKDAVVRATLSAESVGERAGRSANVGVDVCDDNSGRSVSSLQAKRPRH